MNLNSTSSSAICRVFSQRVPFHAGQVRTLTFSTMISPPPPLLNPHHKETIVYTTHQRLVPYHSYRAQFML